MKKLLLWFIPHEDNNHRAHLLKPTSLGILIALYLLNQSFLSSFARLKPGVLGYSSEITWQKVLTQTNLERQNLGLPALKFNTHLSESAAAKAKDMFQNDYWAHNSPQGRTPWDFFKDAGYQYSTAGENLARDFADTDNLIKAWMKSPTHRDNIINPKYQEIGIGVVNGTLNGVKTTLVVQHFGTPANGILENPDLSTLANSQQVNGAYSQLTASNLINPRAITQGLGVIMFGIIIGVLLVDGYIALNNKTHRLTGSNTGHIGFLVIILLLLLFNQQGSLF